MNRYRKARIKAGYSQKEAAISLGISSPSMSDWENGKTKPTNQHLKEMAKLYGTTTDYLLGADKDNADAVPADEAELKEYLVNKIDGMHYDELNEVLSFIKGVEAGRALYLNREDHD